MATALVPTVTLFAGLKGGAVSHSAVTGLFWALGGFVLAWLVVLVRVYLGKRAHS